MTYFCPFCRSLLKQSEIELSAFSCEFYSCEKCKAKRKPLWHWYFGKGDSKTITTEKPHWEILINYNEYGIAIWEVCKKGNIPIEIEKVAFT
jgi:hypothetical protein